MHVSDGGNHTAVERYDHEGEYNRPRSERRGGSEAKGKKAFNAMGMRGRHPRAPSKKGAQEGMK